MHFLSNFGCKKFFMCSVNFGISKIPTHFLKEALVTCPFGASGLLVLTKVIFSTDFSVIIFSILLEYPIIQLDAKIFKLNWLVMISYLNSNSGLILGYLNPSLINQAL